MSHIWFDESICNKHTQIFASLFVFLYLTWQIRQSGTIVRRAGLSSGGRLLLQTSRQNKGQTRKAVSA